jgi:phosphoglycolate phosphatase
MMKAEALRLLREDGHEPDEAMPLTQIMNLYRQSGQLCPKLEIRIWSRVEEIEYAGLENANIEPGIEQVLEFLSAYAHMVVLTNTNEEAARAGLFKLGLTCWLQHILGRGSAPQLKPAPDGMLALLARYPYLTTLDALAVGDALIDIQAARGAGLRFCAYNGSRAEQWQVGINKPDLQLYRWDENAARQVLALINNVVMNHG